MALRTDISSEAEHGTAERLLLAKRISMALLFLGALSAYIGVATLHMSALAFGTQLVLATGLTVLGLLIAALPPNKDLMKAGVVLAVLTISGMLATADDFGTTPFFFLWPAVFAAYFASTRFLVLTLIMISTTLIAALVVSPIEWPVKADIFIGTNLSVGMMAALVSYMRSRAERLHHQLALAANTDGLTGLLNRRAFDPELERLIRKAAATGTALSVVMFDLDHFKRFNDHHGHIVGDDALRRMAGMLVEQRRPIDLVARFGGEEFVVVMPGVETAGARSFAERVAWALGVEPVERALRLTASSGVAALDPDSHTETIVALLTRADQALYAAKGAGRARAAWWTSDGIGVGDEVDVPSTATLTAMPLSALNLAGPAAPARHAAADQTQPRRSA